MNTIEAGENKRGAMKSFVGIPFQPGRRPEWYRRLGYIAPVVAPLVATGALLLLRPLLAPGTVYLLYLVAVVSVAVGWGMWQGVAAAGLAFLLANFFFVEPTLTLTVAAVQDVLALVIFLGLAILTSQLVALLRQEARDARRSQRITAALYELSQSTQGQPELPALLSGVCERLCSVLHLSAAALVLSEATGREIAYAYSGARLSEDQPGLLTVPFDAGYLLLRPTAGLSEDERRLLAAFVEQLQVAIERAQLQGAAVEAEVLRRTDSLRVDLLSAVAHDLRTPLASIKGAATSLLGTRIRWSAEQQREFLSAIVGETDHINSLVRNLLEMSRIEAGRLRPDRQPSAIGEVIGAVVNRLRPSLSDHPLSLLVEPGLPAVMLDEVEIGEALANLIENAAKYTPTGTPIGVDVHRNGNLVEVMVSDSGPGIAADKLQFLFQRFYRAERKTHGTGLGLSIVKAIVEAHGGTVRAANRPGGGMVFSFTLPLGATADPQPAETEIDNVAVAAPLHAN